MLDIKFIRENPELIKMAAQKKHSDFNVDELIELDKKRVEFSQKIEEFRAKQNAVSEEIPKLSGEEKQRKIAEMSLVKEEMKKLDPKLTEISEKWKELMLKVPNVPDMTVPDGNSDADNQEVKVWGEKTKFDFEPKDHIEIMENLKMVDFERGSKVHGFRGYFLTGEGVRLSFAIWNYALDFFSKRGYNPVIPPVIVRKENLYGTGHLPGDADDYYVTQDDDALAGTAEVPLMGFHRDEILDIKSLP
ncbi:MAG TPA: serine--tRNA ligase, partial [Candidatus Paceibacterota bacterium]|nr:serine--tRNA ligase [Candidatus Paceibacterota bacterium]HQB57322.1 serine--tRNA ligase [Candidatus Paceibacterota bacterium]